MLTRIVGRFGKQQVDPDVLISTQDRFVQQFANFVHNNKSSTSPIYPVAVYPVLRYLEPSAPRLAKSHLAVAWPRSYRRGIQAADLEPFRLILGDEGQSTHTHGHNQTHRHTYTHTDTTHTHGHNQTHPHTDTQTNTQTSTQSG